MTENKNQKLFQQYERVMNSLRDLGCIDGNISPSMTLVTDALSVWRECKLGGQVLEEIEKTTKFFLRLAQWRSDNLKFSELIYKEINQIANGRDRINVMELYQKAQESSIPAKSMEERILEADPGKNFYVELEKLIAQKVSESGKERLEIEVPESLIEKTLPQKITNDRAWQSLVRFLIAADNAEELNKGKFLIALNSATEGTALGYARWTYLFGDGEDYRGSSSYLFNTIHKFYKDIHGLMPRKGVMAGVMYTRERESLERIHGADWYPSYHEHEIEMGLRPSRYRGDHLILLKDLYFGLDHKNQEVRLLWINRAGDVKLIHPVYEGIFASSLDPILNMFRRIYVNMESLPVWGLHAKPVLKDRSNLTRFPRITYGKTILNYESWYMPVSMIEGCQEHDLSKCFCMMNKWRISQNLPRYVFVRIRNEKISDKSYYLDFHNPLLLDVLAAQLRQKAPDEIVSFTEMLPNPEQLWLTDAHGKYAIEFSLGCYGKEE